MYVTWLEAEQLFPTCSAQWDVMGHDTLPLFVSDDGYVLWATSPGFEYRYGFSNTVAMWVVVSEAIEMYYPVVTAFNTLWSSWVWDPHARSNEVTYRLHHKDGHFDVIYRDCGALND